MNGPDPLNLDTLTFVIWIGKDMSKVKV